jgi:hypothetical protein
MRSMTRRDYDSENAQVTPAGNDATAGTQELRRLKSVREQQLRNFKLQRAGFAGKSLK